MLHEEVQMVGTNGWNNFSYYHTIFKHMYSLPGELFGCPALQNPLKLIELIPFSLIDHTVEFFSACFQFCFPLPDTLYLFAVPQNFCLLLAFFFSSSFPHLSSYLLTSFPCLVLLETELKKDSISR